MQLEKKRDIYVDVSKGIAMLMVVSIHTEVFHEINFPYPIIAVPFFFFMSGFFDKSDKPLRQWIGKTSLSLIGTTVIWTTIGFIYLSFLNLVKTGFSVSALSTVPYLFNFGVAWFLVALFYAKILVWLFSKLKLPVYIVLLIFIAAGAFISKINIPVLVDEGIAAIPFYYLGKVIYPYLRRIRNFELTMLALLGLACMIAMRGNWFPCTLVPIDIDYHVMMYPVFFITTSLSFATIIWVSRKLANISFLADYGTQSLGILVIHPLLLHTCAVVLNRVFIVGSALWIAFFLCAYVAVCILSYYFSVLISRHCPILLGKKPRSLKWDGPQEM